MPSLTKEQEEIAFSLIESGDEVAREQFVYLNQKLVGSRARKHRGKGLTWEELLSAGNIGLLIAIAKFDYRQGNKFSTCAVPWIDGEITAAFKAKSGQNKSDKRICQTGEGVPLLIEEDDTQEEQLQRVAAKDLVKQDEPESEELTDHVDLQEAVHQDTESDGGLGMNATQTRSEGIGTSAGGAEGSTDHLVFGSDEKGDGKPGGGYNINFVEDHSLYSRIPIATKELQRAFLRLIRRLPDVRQARILVLLHGLGGEKKHTFAEVGAIYGISGQRIAKIEEVALRNIRDMQDPEMEELFCGVND